MSQNDPRAEVLKEIQRAFAQHRETGDARRNFYPPEIRMLAVAAIQKGYSRHEVTQAAGISAGSLLNWLNVTPGRRVAVVKPKARRLLLAPVQLKVVKSRIPAKNTSEAPPAIARIHFRGGATLECPVSAVSAELVSALNGGES
jgi:hypothetical protein